MTIANAIEKMIAFYRGDLHDIDHFLKVWSLARTIGVQEGLPDTVQLTLELAAVVLCFPVYALVDMLSWDWLNWGSLSLSDLVTYWQAGGGPVALWIWMGLGETALILAVRWVVDRVRRRMRQAEFEAVTQPRQ